MTTFSNPWYELSLRTMRPLRDLFFSDDVDPSSRQEEDKQRAAPRLPYRLNNMDDWYRPD